MEVRVIGPEAEQLGVVAIKMALELAREHELDLVEIAPTAKPPVCRIMDYSKYKYDQEKKERRIKRNQHVAHLKQIRLKPNIGEGDYQIKLKQIASFLDKKDKVKVNMFFRGREMTHKELGQRVVERLISDIAKHGQPDGGLAMEGRVMIVLLTPNSGKSSGVRKSLSEAGRKE